MNSRSSTPRRRGVTLLEVVVTVAILGILASVIVVGVEASSRIGGQAKRIDDAAFVLAQLRDASVRYNLGVTRGSTLPAIRDTSFTSKIGTITFGYGGVNPGRLSQLTTKIKTTDLNSCGFAYTTSQVTAWTRAFYSSPISSTTPFQISPGFAADDVLQRYDTLGNPKVYTSADTGRFHYPGLLAIVIRNVAIDDAKALAARMEGDQSGGAQSVVRFTPNGNAPVTVFYQMGIHGC